MEPTERLKEMLRCPKCKRGLHWENLSLSCSHCNSTYGVYDNVIPIYDLYLDGTFQESGRDPKQVWDCANFEKGYERIGYHECGAEFDKQLGYPEEISRFLFERVKGRMLEWVKPDQGHSILDVGCGAGYFLHLIYEKYRAHGFSPIIAGVDISTFQLFYMARRMHKEGMLDAVVIHGNGEYLPFADESFDLITCSEVLEHIKNPYRALSEMHRVLKPKGTLLLSTPSMMAQKGWGIVLSPLISIGKMLRHHKSDSKVIEGGYDIPWYPKEFQKAIRAARLEIKHFECNAVIPHPWYFKFLPKLLVKPVVKGFGLVDRYLKVLLKSLALHFVVYANKCEGVGTRVIS